MAVIFIIAAIFAFCVPEISQLLRTSWISYELGLVMLGMGMTLELKDIKLLFIHPKEIIIGAFAQFAIMPLMALALSKIFNLSPELIVGVVLVGCCPGGTASNVMTYLAKGDLSLSVGMTSINTLLAPFLTPLLVWLLIGTEVNVNALAMFMSIILVVIIPIIIGLTIKHFMVGFTQNAISFLPSFSTIMITLIIMTVVAANASALKTSGWLILLVVVLHNISGLTLGYCIGKLFAFSYPKRVAISIETGMQNSGLACSLAAQHFQTLAMATVPGAIFSVWHNLSGALVAKLYRRK